MMTKFAVVFVSTPTSLGSQLRTVYVEHHNQGCRTESERRGIIAAARKADPFYRNNDVYAVRRVRTKEAVSRASSFRSPA